MSSKFLTAVFPPASRAQSNVWWIPLDALLAVGAYLLAYRLRFSGPVLADFLPGALRSLPFVAVSQVLALAVAGLYGPARGRQLIGRVFVASVLGTAVGVALTWAVLGFEGISRGSFALAAALFGLAVAAGRSLEARWRVIPAGTSASSALAARGPIERPPEAADLVDIGFPLGGGAGSLLRYRELLRNLVWKDLKLKYRGSVFGFMWSLVNPLLMIAVYSVAFKYILRIRAEGFTFFLLLGILPWTFFANSAGMSTGSVVDNGGLIKSVYFPRAILPVSTVLFNFSQYLLTIMVFLPVMLVMYRVVPVTPMLLFPAFLALQVLFTIGIALMLATGTTFLRDIRHLLEITLAVMFWTTPIVYEFRHLPDAIKTFILLSPLSPFVIAYQQMFYYREWPDASVAGLAVVYAVSALLLGSYLFTRFQHEFAEEI
jgi:ABC-type polysaccharide/polyol phosphate export permease